MTTTTEPVVRREVTVAAPVERCFEVFTTGLASWWPMETHHIGAQPPVDVLMERRPGGRLYERDADGSECDWGFVLAWEPPTRLVYSWHLNERWEFDPDPERASKVEVRFTPVEGGTRVELEHGSFERHGAGAETIREAVSGDGGWSGLLALYRHIVEAV